MSKVLMDIEVYPNCFLLGVRDIDTGEGKVYEVTKENNDLKAIVDYMIAFRGFMISFNGNHYDLPALAYICQEYRHWDLLSNEDITEKIQDFSNKIIKEDFIDSKYKYYFKNFISVDLYLYWSRMLRLSKKISLKSLGIQINYPVCQELPYPPGTYLTKSEIEEVKNYNYIHDLGIMEKLLTHPIKWQGKYTTFNKQIQLRANIRKEHGLPKAIFSWDEPKIASELLLKFYCDKTGKNPYEVRKSSYFEGQRLELFNPQFKLKIFQDVFQKMQNADRQYGEELIFNHNNTSIKISLGIGGIHTVNSNEIYETDNNDLVYTSDVSSLYPNLILNYQTIRQPSVLQQYSQIKDERMIAKKTGDKNKNVTYKLILNSTSGLLDSKYSWLYYPEGAMKMRLMGQLVMLKTVEELSLAGFKVVSINTDGCEVIVPRSRENEYISIVNSVGTFFNLDFEHEVYSKIVYSNINNYVAFTEDSIKQKGRTFITEPNIGDSCNSLIIPKALVEYFKNGTKPDKFIKECDNIFDFCLSLKSSKKFTVYHGGEKQQRLNRFYVSKGGKYLYKSSNGIKMNNMLKGWGVTIYNNHIEQPINEYNINYSFYIGQANKQIAEIERLNQITLF